MNVSAESDGMEWGSLLKVGIIVGIRAELEISDVDVVIFNGDYTTTEDMTFMVSGLDTNTVYYARPFGIDLGGMVHYGSAVPFTTLELSVPTIPVVTADRFLPISRSAVTLYGTVESNGGSAVSERGFVYGTSNNPVIGSSVTKITGSGTGMGEFSAALTGLAQDTVYYARAYAINNDGT